MGQLPAVAWLPVAGKHSSKTALPLKCIHFQEAQIIRLKETKDTKLLINELSEISGGINLSEGS